MQPMSTLEQQQQLQELYLHQQAQQQLLAFHATAAKLASGRNQAAPDDFRQTISHQLILESGQQAAATAARDEAAEGEGGQDQPVRKRPNTKSEIERVIQQAGGWTMAPRNLGRQPGGDVSQSWGGLTSVAPKHLGSLAVPLDGLDASGRPLTKTFHAYSICTSGYWHETPSGTRFCTWQFWAVLHEADDLKERLKASRGKGAGKKRKQGDAPPAGAQPGPLGFDHCDLSAAVTADDPPWAAHAWETPLAYYLYSYQPYPAGGRQ